jgi:hypothetical protein
LLLAALLFIASLAACSEGADHDQSNLCVIDPFMPPPFLGFEYWGTVGITLATVASGLVLAILLMREDRG